MLQYLQCIVGIVGIEDVQTPVHPGQQAYVMYTIYIKALLHAYTNEYDVLQHTMLCMLQYRQCIVGIVGIVDVQTPVDTGQQAYVMQVTLVRLSSPLDCLPLATYISSCS